jgi:hypothetical protein
VTSIEVSPRGLGGRPCSTRSPIDLLDLLLQSVDALLAVLHARHQGSAPQLQLGLGGEWGDGGLELGLGGEWGDGGLELGLGGEQGDGGLELGLGGERVGDLAKVSPVVLLDLREDLLQLAARDWSRHVRGVHHDYTSSPSSSRQSAGRTVDTSSGVGSEAGECRALRSCGRRCFGRRGTSRVDRYWM